MANNREYLERLRLAVEHMHNCRAAHSASVPVHEVFRGQTAWRGIVEVFDIAGHQKAKRCFAWSHREGENDQGERFVAVLEIPPVVSAETAVRASIVAESKQQNERRQENE